LFKKKLHHSQLQMYFHLKGMAQKEDLHFKMITNNKPKLEDQELDIEKQNLQFYLHQLLYIIQDLEVRYQLPFL
jgi:hypothetical protein